MGKLALRHPPAAPGVFDRLYFHFFGADLRARIATQGEAVPSSDYFAKETAPTFVEGIADAISVEAGMLHTCALLSDGLVKCWGHAGTGQLGLAKEEWPVCDFDPDGRPTYCTHIPTPVPGIPPATKLSVGGQHACIIDMDGQAWCWGTPFDPDETYFSDKPLAPPVQIPGLTDAREIAVVEDHACVIVDSGRVFCWGDNESDQIYPIPDDEPDHVLTPEEVEEILKSRPQPLMLGGPEDPWSLRPIQSAIQVPVTSISVGIDSTCAISQDDARVKCLGKFLFHELIPQLADVRELALGKLKEPSASHACAALRDGNLYCWGRNHDGEVGDGTEEEKPQPVLISAPISD